MNELTELLQRMAEETPEKTAQRAAHAFDELAAPFANAIVLFGAGSLGKITLFRLQRAGVTPLAFADSNPNLTGTRIAGAEVLSPDKAIERFARSAAFVVSIYNGSSVSEQLRQAGCERVVPLTALCWKYVDTFIPDRGVDLPQNLLPHALAIRECYDLVADEASRKEILDQLRWRYWLDDSQMSPPLPAKDTYFPNELISPAREGESYVDCGAFNGESIQAFLDHAQGPVRHIYATEPDAGSRELLSRFTDGLPESLRKKVTIWPYALGKEDGLVRFAAVGDICSRVGAEGEAVECRTFDDLPWTVPPTYVKMDIEGAEPDAIVGGAKLFGHHQPVIVACLYHRSEHISGKSRC
jgi:FkbM family methyltransferase